MTPGRHVLGLGGDQTEEGEARPEDQDDGQDDHDTRREPRWHPPGQPPMQRRHHDIQHRGTDQPGAERPEGDDQGDAQGEDQPCGPLAFGIEEWHPKSVCRKGFRRYRQGPGRTCPGRNRPRNWHSPSSPCIRDDWHDIAGSSSRLRQPAGPHLDRGRGRRVRLPERAVERADWAPAERDAAVGVGGEPASGRSGPVRGGVSPKPSPGGRRSEWSSGCCTWMASTTGFSAPASRSRATDGTFLGYSGCTTDVTDRRALEQRLAQLGTDRGDDSAGRRHRARLQQRDHRHPGPRGAPARRVLPVTRGAGGPGPHPAGGRSRGDPHPSAPLIQPPAAPLPAFPRPQPARLRHPERHPPGGGSGGGGPIRAGE